MKNNNTKLVKYENNDIINLYSENKEIREFINKEGKQIYRENEFFRDLRDLMETPQFQKFYQKYFTNWDDVELMVMYMKLYKSIKDSYIQKFKHSCSLELMLYILREVIRTNESRKIIIDQFQNFKKGILAKKKKKKLLKNTDFKK